MAVITYELYLMNVPFNSDYKHIVYFGTGNNAIEQQTSTFQNRALYHFENLNIIVKNNAFILKGDTTHFDKCNYMMYKSSRDTRWYYAFIDEVIYDTYKGTTIYHTIDVWQTYHTTASFKESFIERAHISRDDDKPFKNLLPEPFSFSKVYTKPLTTAETFGTELQPYYVLHALGHIPAVVLDNSPIIVSVNGYCGGVFTHACFGATTPNALTPVVDSYANAIQTTPILALPVMYRDARYALEYCNIVPSFTTDNQNHTDIEDRLDMHITTIQNVFKHINTGDTLACGYKPINSKLYNSQFQVLSINTGNGMHHEFDMSLFNNKNSLGEDINILDNVYVQLTGSCGGDGDFYVTFPDYNYATRSTRHIRVSYGASLSLGYDQSNSGEYRQQRQINAISKMINTGVSLASSYSMINKVGQTAMNSFNNLNTERQETAIAGLNSTAENLNIKRGIAEAQTIQNIGNLGLEYTNKEAQTSELKSIGNNTDQLDMATGLYNLTIELNSIKYDEAVMIDKYFERYGYYLSQYDSINTYINTRTVWNYIKTQNCIIDIDAPNTDNAKFNSIFDNGTTIWHNINQVGNYELTNS